MSDQTRSDSRARTPAITLDREGRLVRYQEWTDEEFQAIRALHASGAGSTSVPAGPAPGATDH